MKKWFFAAFAASICALFVCGPVFGSLSEITGARWQSFAQPVKAFLASQHSVTLLGIRILRPISLAIALVAAALCVAAAVFYIRTRRGNLSRLWLGTALAVFAAAALAHAVGTQLYLGDSFVAVTDWASLAAQTLAMWGLGCLAFSASYAGARGKLQRAMQISAAALAGAYTLALLAGVLLRVVFLLSPTLLFICGAALLALLIVTDALMYRHTGFSRFASFLVGRAGLALCALCAFALARYPLAGAAGFWLTGADVFLALFCGWVLYVRLALRGQVWDV